MTREQHIEFANDLRMLAREHLNNSIENKNGFDRDEYQLYKEYSKRANKHRGIASAMWTKEMKTKYGYSIQ